MSLRPSKAKAASVSDLLVKRVKPLFVDTYFQRRIHTSYDLFKLLKLIFQTARFSNLKIHSADAPTLFQGMGNFVNKNNL